MPLKAYRKSTTFYTQDQVHTPDYVTISPLLTADSAPLNMWGLFNAGFGSLKNLVASSSTAGLVIPLLFIVLGLGLIYKQYSSEITQYVKESVGYYNQGTTALVGESYIPGRLQYLSNPGADYFKRLTDAAFAQHIVEPDMESNKFQGTLYLTIPALGFTRLPIKANVESSSKTVYDQVLNTALAHFAGTSLPQSSKAQNIVIYGHSASGSYEPRPDDVLAAFSFLSDLRVGDEIILEASGTEYKYRMSKSKIVEPDDTSIITGTPGKESLTLFTCYPNGNNSQRYVAVATPVS